MAKRPSSPSSIRNRRASYDYALGESLIVGLQLTGAETKSLRQGHGHLRGAYVTVRNNELWLINATITGSSGAAIAESDQTRARKLLARKREIIKLVAAKQQGNTIVPLEVLTKGHYVKLKIASGRGKRQYDKRQALRARDDARRSAQAFK